MSDQPDDPDHHTVLLAGFAGYWSATPALADGGVTVTRMQILAPSGQ